MTSPARTKRAGGHRLRSDASPNLRHGVLTHDWVGPEVPLFVPLSVGRQTLEILDSIPGGYMAVYRDVSGTTGCGLPDDKNVWRNCASEVRLFDCAGTTLVSVPLEPLASRRDMIEIQDVRYADGTLYFNEACMTYSREAGGRCSSLVALDPYAKKVLWRTGPLVSNNAFLVVGEHLVTTYGFTSEPAAIRVVRRKDGAIVDRKPLPSSADDDLSVSGNVVRVNLYNMLGAVELAMSGFDGPSPKLTEISRPRPPAPERPRIVSDSSRRSTR